uniref:t-SNARE coiled-coil homology domain-containing protein n=1 Tax=Heterorhabditis bacteriophora TaxID=37862 RepID=A0A1I7XAR1_HETBA
MTCKDMLQNNLPSRRVIFDESLWESKLSLLLPLEMIKIYRKWIAEFCYLLESRQHLWPSFSVSALHDVLREVRENAETYEQCFEFLQNYSVLSCGTVSTIPLRFQHGGLHRLYSSLDIDNTYHDNLFWSKRQILLDLKRNIGQISHRLEIEWKIASFGKPDKVCLEIHSGIKQVYERLKDNLRWISGVEQCAEFLMEEEKRRCGIGIKNDNIVLDSLQNQMDNVEAMLISLNTKIAAIDTLNDHQAKREIYEKSAKEAMSNCLNMLLVLANSILESQLFGLVLALQKNSSAHAYFHIQVRTDFVLSQAITIASTAILNQIHRGWAVLNGIFYIPRIIQRLINLLIFYL